MATIQEMWKTIGKTTETFFYVYDGPRSMVTIIYMKAKGLGDLQFLARAPTSAKWVRISIPFPWPMKIGRGLVITELDTMRQHLVHGVSGYVTRGDT